MPATLAQRVYAILIDGLIVSGLLFGLPVILQPLALPDFVRGRLMAVIFFALLFAYDPLQVAFFGQTPGHRCLRIKVVNADGGRVSILTAYARFITKTILGLFSFLTMMGPKERAIHDMVTGSKVIETPT